MIEFKLPEFITSTYEKMNGRLLLWAMAIIVIILIILVAASSAYAKAETILSEPVPISSSPRMVRLPGHILPALAKAALVPSKLNSGDSPITLTIVLKRDDQAGFENFLGDLYDPQSKTLRHFLIPE